MLLLFHQLQDRRPTITFIPFHLPKMQQRALLLSALVAVARAQQAGTQTSETKPSLTWQKCTASGCTDQSGSVGIDANWRWVHSTDGTTNCYTGNEVS
jgi:cellulose 1,4-beta-cellobiosidase